jgi:putative FmdB family regulatory protein
MPFYEYECASCKFYTEVMQKISDVPLRKCPSCGKSTLQKLISAPVFRLKGGGWYETDFKSDKESKRNLAGDGNEGADAKPRETPPPDAKGGEVKAVDSKSESKPAEKAGSSDSGAGGTARRSASKSTASKPGRSAARPVAKAAARKPAPKVKAKAKASKRRGR